MTTLPDKNKIESIFLEAVALNGENRSQFIENACNGERQIRAEVERLLRADDLADSLLDRPAQVESTSASEAAPMEGTEVGPFKLLQQIGEGGFGVVYMAEQTQPVRRKVALKIVKPGMDSKEVVARFEAERQALAMMDHPNIAKVLDAGTTESGRPFFAMELVKGVSITEYCDANNLPTKERLQLFQQVCRAVQHAHQKGIIHRDIKPSNVMVTLHDGEPVPKVIDFGVAKALSQHLTEKTLFTRYGQIVGTPQYMSPEQAEMSGLDVDTRSDIYSLGVLLYELLTGQTPLDAQALRSAGYDAMRKMIRESEPPKPSTKYGTLDQESATCIASHRATIPAALSKTIAGDLDWIVMKSLDKNRNRRYDSANGLLSDIDRYLDNEPVVAGPPTFGYLFTKLYRRNRLAVLTTVAFLCLSLLATGLTTWAWLDAIDQRDIANVAVGELGEKQKELETQKTEAEVLARKAKTEATRSQATLDVLKSLLAQASPDPKLGTEVKVSDFLKTFARRLETERLADPEVEIEVRTTLAKSFSSFSETEKAKEQMDIAEHIGRKHFESTSLDLASFLFRHGVLRARVGAGNQTKLMREALAMLGEEENTQFLRVRIMTRLGWLIDNPEEAESHFRSAIVEFKKLSDSQQADLDDLPQRGLASNLNKQDKMQEAEKMADVAIRLSKTLENQSELAESLFEMSKIKWNLRDRDAARQSADLAIEEADAIHDVPVLLTSWDWRAKMEWLKPTFDLDSTRDLALRCEQFLEEYWGQIHTEGGYWRTGGLLGAAHGMLLAVDEPEAAKRISERAKLCSPSQRRSMFGETAQVLRALGHIEQSIAFYDRAIADLKQGDNYWNLIQCGRSYEAVRDFENQLKELNKAKAIRSEASRPWDSMALDFSVASALANSGKIQEAKAVFAALATEMPNHSLRLWGKPTASAYLYWVEMSRTDSDVIDDSPESYYGAAINLLEGDMPDWPIGRVYTHAVSGMIAERKGDFDTAIDRFVKANKERPGTFAQTPTEWVTDHMVELLVNAKRFDECETILRDDIKRRDTQVSPIHPERAFVRLRLVQFLVDHDRDTTGAKALLSEAKRIYDYHANVLPKAEREKLNELERSIAQTER